MRDLRSKDLQTYLQSLPTAYDDYGDDDYDQSDTEINYGTFSTLLTIATKSERSFLRPTGGHSDDSGDDTVDATAELTLDQRAIVLSCVDEIRQVIGDKLSQNRLARIVLRSEYDLTRSLDVALEACQPKPLPKTGNHTQYKLFIYIHCFAFEIYTFRCAQCCEVLKIDCFCLSVVALERVQDDPCPVAVVAVASLVSESQQKHKTSQPSSTLTNIASANAPFAKLSDLTSFHLNKSATPQRPTIASDSTVPLSIPKLNIQFGNKSVTSVSHVPAFIIPKFSANFPTASGSGTSLTPHAMSLRKIMDLQKITLNTESSTTAQSHSTPAAFSAPILVNLTAAASAQVLRPSSTSLLRSSTESVQTHDVGTLDDIDMTLTAPICHPCDQFTNAFTPGGLHHNYSVNTRHALRDNLTVECQLDASALATRKLTRKTRPSRIGRILCARFLNGTAIAVAAASVQHEFARGRHMVRPYTFEKPSPDDVILRQLAKWKK